MKRSNKLRSRIQKSKKTSKIRKGSRKSKKVKTRIDVFKKWFKKQEPELTSQQTSELAKYIEQECKIKRRNSLQSPEEVYKYRECEQEVKSSKPFKLLLGNKTYKTIY